MVDGKPIYKEEILSAKDPVNAQMWAIGAQIPRGFHQDFAYQEQWTNEVGLESIALYESGDYLTEQFLGVAMNEEEQKVYDKYNTALRTYMLEMQQIWVLGTEDVEAGWDAYQEQLDDLGYNEVIGVMQTAYDRQYGS
jgi:putative aldouronate transport system substrate-binding protein